MRKSAPEQRATIMAAALEQFGISGMDSTSVEVIAQRAQVSPAYVHRLFGTKSDLMLAAVAEHTASAADTWSAARRRPRWPAPTAACLGRCARRRGRGAGPGHLQDHVGRGRAGGWWGGRGQAVHGPRGAA